MPTIHRLRNCKIEIRARDHRPAHVHVLFKDGREALVKLASGELVARQPVRPMEIAEALAWISARKDELTALFEELQT